MSASRCGILPIGAIPCSNLHLLDAWRKEEWHLGLCLSGNYGGDKVLV